MATRTNNKQSLRFKMRQIIRRTRTRALVAMIQTLKSSDPLAMV